MNTENIGMITKILPDEIKTERLVLRRPKKRDADDFFRYASKNTVGPMAGWQPHHSNRETKQYLAYYAKEGHVLAITEKDQDIMIGSVGLHKDEHRSETGVRQLGYALSPDYWNRGYATEAALAVVKHAFEKNLYRMVTAYCYPENTPSKKLLEKIGFSYEGCLRKSFVLFDGTVHDLDCYSMTAEEYVYKYY